MKNKEKNYNLNLDMLVPFFLLGDEEVRNRIWFKNANETDKEKYKKVAKECYGSISTILEGNEQIIRWKNENWTCDLPNLPGKNISFILEKKKDIEWPEVWVILRIYFSKWNVARDAFEGQIKKLLELYFKEKATSFSEQRIKFKLRFYGKNEQNKPDILISLIDDKSSEIKKENKIALDITEVDTSPTHVRDKGSAHRAFDGDVEKRNFDKARETKKELDRVDIHSYFSNLLVNMGNILLKKNEKDYACGKTVIWVILLAYCHIEVKNLITGKENCLIHEIREIDEKKFSHFLLKEIKGMSEKFQIDKKKFNFDYLMVKFAESTHKQQSIERDGKLYKFIPFVKDVLYIPVISGEIKVEGQLEDIEKKYKDELKSLEIGWCGVNIPLEDEENDDEWEVL